MLNGFKCNPDSSHFSHSLSVYDQKRKHAHSIVSMYQHCIKEETFCHYNQFNYPVSLNLSVEIFLFLCSVVERCVVMMTKR